MLRVEDLEIRYQNLVAVRGLTLSVAEGELVGLIGPNGAGKTSTLSAIAGAVATSGGSIEFLGESIRGRKPEAILRRGIALIPEGRRVFTRLTVKENLFLGASSRRDDEVDADLERVTGRFPILARYLESKAGQLSGGEQQQLAVARALMSRPRLILMDEPTLGLAPLMVGAIFELLLELKADGVTTLLVEQNARRTLAVADRTYVLQNGSLRLETTAAEADIDQVERQYLGVDTAAIA